MNDELKNIVVFGTGNTARVVIEIIEVKGKYNILGLIDATKGRIGERVKGYRIIGSDADLLNAPWSGDVVGGIIAVGDNFLRKVIADKIIELLPNFVFVSIVHPSTVISQTASIGDGSMIMAGVIINNNGRIGRHCLLNTNSSIDHDSIMENYSSLAPGVVIGGCSHLGECSSISLGANVINDVTIGEHTVVGAGSTVLNDIPPYTISYGTPCKTIKKRRQGDKYF